MKIQITILLLLCVFISACATKQTVDPAEAALSRIEASGIRDFNLQVEISAFNQATVTGRVNSEQEREIAIDAIKEDPEISSVEDKIIVKRKKSVSEASEDLNALSKNVLKEISKRPLIGHLKLSYRTDGMGNLFITGEAPSEALVKRIREVAEKNAEPDLKVNVDIRVPPAPSDAVIKRRIEEAFNGDPSIDYYRFKLSVVQGVATIRGHFPKHEEIDRILALVLMVDGVKDIEFVDTKAR